jgi:hypothetical protein
MTWTTIRWVWRLEAPLYIGMPPAGSLNRCRPYVPARAVHGALAAEFARAKVDDASPCQPDYGKLGYELGNQCRFTYLYPAERVGDDYQPWLPCFKKDTGLQWECAASQDVLPDRLFRRRLLDARPGVSIAPDSDSAADGQLWETECLSQWWHDPDGRQETPEPVFLLGYVFLKDGAFQRCLRECEVLFLGGDARYGFGKVRQASWTPLTDGHSVFDASVTYCENGPVLRTKRILGHESVCLQATNGKRRGMQEIVGGWNISEVFQDGLSWAPGSKTEGDARWVIDRFGYWKHHDAPLEPVA